MEKPNRGRRITSPRLEDLLKFRHAFNNIYGEELVYEEIEPHAKSIDESFTSVSKDLNTFTDFLEKREEDV